MLMWHKDWFDSAEKCTLTVLWSKNECMRFFSCCCICVQAQHLGAGGEHPGWQADFGVWAKVSVAASWGALRVLWVISLDFYLCIHFFSLACFYILAPILKSLKHVCSVPPPPFTFLSCVLVLNYVQCLFLWVLVFTHSFIPPHPPFVSLNSSSLLPNWKKKSAPNLFLSVAKLFEMLVLLMEMFRVKFKYQKTFNGRQGIQQMTETVFSLHVIPLFAGSYISCPPSTLSLMKIRAKNKIFLFYFIF